MPLVNAVADQHWALLVGVPCSPILFLNYLHTSLLSLTELLPLLLLINICPLKSLGNLIVSKEELSHDFAFVLGGDSVDAKILGEVFNVFQDVPENLAQSASERGSQWDLRGLTFWLILLLVPPGSFWSHRTSMRLLQHVMLR